MAWKGRRRSGLPPGERKKNPQLFHRSQSMRPFSRLSPSTRFGITLASSLVAALFAASAAEARITSIVIDCARSQSPTFCPGQSPTFGGLSFGSVGQYEKLRGRAFGELRPTSRHNEVITDISLAPRNA